MKRLLYMLNFKILSFAFKWEGSCNQNIIPSTPLYEKFVVIAMFRVVNKSVRRTNGEKTNRDCGIIVHVNMKQIKSAICHQKSEDLGWTYTSGLDAQFQFVANIRFF